MAKRNFEEELLSLFKNIVINGLRTRPTTTTVTVSMASITDTAFTSLTTNDYLKFNGSNWVNTTISASDLPTAIDAVNIADGSVSNTEFQYLDGVTSAIQTQMDTKITASSTDTLTNKTIDADGTGNVITNIGSSEVKSEMITGQTEVVALAGDSILISDADDSGNLKRDTIDGLLDIYDAKTSTLTNKTFDANGTGNSLSNVDLTADVINDLPVTEGGTGVSTLTDGGVLLGSGTGAVTAMAVLADGELIVGDGTTDPVAESGATLRTSIGVSIGSDVQAFDADLTELATGYTSEAATTAATFKFLEGTNNGTNGVTLAGAASTADVTVTLPAAADTLVGKATTDTLTNKTIDSASNTITTDLSEATVTGTTAEFNTALSDGSFATLAGTETLTNKTFDANGTGNSLSNVDVADLANGTDGELITWSSSAAPATVAVGTATHILTSNGAGAAPTFQVPADGDWVLISSATASSSATIDFTGISSTYYMYIVVLEAILPATDDVDLLIRTSTDGGSSYDAGSTDYLYMMRGANWDATASGTGSGVAAAASIFMTNTGQGSAAAEHLSGVVNIINPSATNTTHVSFDQLYSDFGGTLTFMHGWGKRNSAADVDAIRFLYSSGNIASGEFKLYGIKAA